MYCYGTGWKPTFNLGQYTRVFQAEVYAIKEHLYSLRQLSSNSIVLQTPDHLKTGLGLPPIPQATGYT
jgi:hypothetical protein